jgi:hypothetical protein
MLHRDGGLQVERPGTRVSMDAHGSYYQHYEANAPKDRLNDMPLMGSLSVLTASRSCSSRRLYAFRMGSTFHDFPRARRLSALTRAMMAGVVVKRAQSLFVRLPSTL